MSKWAQHGMTDRVIQALRDVHLSSPDGHPLGRPFVSSYQIAIALEEAEPGLAAALGKRVGGRGTGAHHSLAQYIGNELSKQIAAEGPAHPVEGAFVSNEKVVDIVYRGDGDIGEVRSSLAGTDFDMALFRLR